MSHLPLFELAVVTFNGHVLSVLFRQTLTQIVITTLNRLISLHCSSLLSWVNYYLALDSGDIVVHAVWLNASLKLRRCSTGKSPRKYILEKVEQF